jgi:hypothetical protein
MTISCHNHIKETYHPDAIVGRVQYASVRTLVITFVLGVLFAASVSVMTELPVLVGTGIFSVITLPILVAAGSSRINQTSEMAHRSVSLNNGCFTAVISGESESHPLTACCWFRGKARDDTQLGSYAPVGRACRSVMIIVFPSGRKVACGADDFFYALWLSALRSAGCRHVLRQEGLLGVLFFLMSVLGLVGGGFLGWHLGSLVRDAVLPQLVNNPMSNLLPAVLAICLAWGCGVTPWLIPGWRRYTEKEDQAFIKMTVGVPIKLAIPAGLLLGGNWITGIALAGTFGVLFMVITLRLNRPSQTGTPKQDAFSHQDGAT